MLFFFSLYDDYWHYRLPADPKIHQLCACPNVGPSQASIQLVSTQHAARSNAWCLAAHVLVSTHFVSFLGIPDGLPTLEQPKVRLPNRIPSKRVFLGLFRWLPRRDWPDQF